MEEDALRPARAERRRQDHHHPILTTLLTFDGGRATVGGFDVIKEAQLVRAVIGLTGQFAAVDDDLTGVRISSSSDASVA